jgi:pilus assembly protein Flp/PilA
MVDSSRVHHLLIRVALAYTQVLERSRQRIRAGLAAREEGQGMVEYALILVLIAIVVLLILTTVGKQVKNVFSNISNGLAS